MLGKRERRDIGDKDFVLSVNITQNFLTELTLNFSWERVSGTKIPQEIVGEGGGASSGVAE